jgi:NAD(P)-dependent dehydrogenase (short-subunit alcohol dehydrogenase family)
VEARPRQWPAAAATRFSVSGFALGEELAPHGCTAVALTPGWMRSEMMLEHYGVTEANWRGGAATNPHLDCWRCLVEVQEAGRPADPTGNR